MTATPTDATTLISRRIDDWRRRLIDLSNRNRLIAYKATKATTLEIVAPSVDELLADPGRAAPWDFYFPPEPAAEEGSGEGTAAAALDELVVRSQVRHRERRVNEIQVSEHNPKRIARILDNLAKRSSSEFQDKALRILYIAAGFLDWHDDQRDKPISSPLVLVPVELRRHSPRHPYQLFFVDDEEIVINPSLTEKLRRDASLAVPGDWEWEDKPIHDELDEIRRAVAGHGWTVREDAAIGLFSFQKYVMYRDLLDNEAQLETHPVVRSLATGRLVPELRDADPDVPSPQELDENQPPAETLSILDADASQRMCVEAAKRGRSFVMQGPPGTGKSQTIANVIAEAIGDGKKVLFVSEKAAALDVVYKRLSASSLDEYCLMLHGEHAARREVVQALDHSLVTSLQARPGMRPDDLERLGNLRTLLNGSAELLHLPQPLLGGRTLREIHEELAELHAAPSIGGASTPTAVAGIEVLDEYQQLREVFERISQRWHTSRRDYLWRGYKAERFTTDDHGRVLALLRELATATEALASPAAAIAARIDTPPPTSLEAAQHLSDLGKHLERAPAIEAHWLDAPSGRLIEDVDGAESAYERLASAERDFAVAFSARRATDFPDDVSLRVRTARDDVHRTAGWAAGWDALAQLPDAQRALGELPALIATVRSSARSIASRLGQPEHGFTAKRIDELVELADLAFHAERRPEPGWLVRAGQARAQGVLDAIASDLDAYQSRRAAILTECTAEALELDAGPMAERFATQYTSVFSKLSGAYRTDARALKAVRRDGKLPGDPATELRQIAAAREFGERIDEADEHMRGALGSYAAGRDTDTSAVDGALGIALHVGQLADADTDLEKLAQRIGVGSQPDPSLAQAADQLRDAKHRLVDRLPALQRFVGTPEQLWQRDLDELEALVQAVDVPLRRLFALIDDLNSGAVGAAADIELVQRRADMISELHVVRREVDERRTGWRAALGPAFAEHETPWDTLREAGDWLEGFNDICGRPIPPAIRSQIAQQARAWPAFREVEAGCARMRAAVDAFTALFDELRASELAASLQTATSDNVLSEARRFIELLDELGDWTEGRAARQLARQAGWGSFVDALIHAEVNADDVIQAFARAYWNRRLEALYDTDPDLAEDLRGGAFQRWVDEFRSLDRALLRTAPDRLIARREQARTVHISSPGSEIDLLRREARKKRRHLPVRVLLSRIPTLLSELKPCLMMSPLTVSHFLAPDHTFDLVVFDEASQVPPQDAINCIYRGKQLVVAGDAKQLPPTPFFQVAELDELAPDEEEASTREDMESVLDSCEALLPSHALQWHYRSRSESLIAFSNSHIYGDSLTTFPTNDERTRRMGVGFIHVPDGVYDRGRTATNRREAQVTAQRVIDHLDDGSGRSVGVIAFNSTQANAIAEELDLLRAHSPELEEHFGGDRLDAVFVKHLEAVQGDERDVIVFSVGYGRDPDGRFTMNFGPLNKDGGQRRLNVAITRARERLELVSSVRSHDFDLSETASAGARMLRDYVAFAEQQSQAFDAGPEDDGEDFDSALEAQVAEAIKALGYGVAPNVGAGTFRIDLAVRAPDDATRFLLAIECDGHGYARTPTARDRERLRHDVLERMGWGPIHRIWSLDWVRNRAAEVGRLEEAIKAAQARLEAESDLVPEANSATGGMGDDPPRERVERVVHDLGSGDLTPDLPWTERYQRANLGYHSSFYEFHETASRRVQTDMLVDLLAVEAPVSIDYAIRRLADAWGLQRAGHRVVTAARQAIGQAQRRGAAEVRGEFIWRPGQILTKVRVPDPAHPDDRRGIEEIAPEELDLAIARVRDSSVGVSDEQLLIQVARLIGFDRAGGRIQAALKERLSAARDETPQA